MSGTDRLILAVMLGAALLLARLIVVRRRRRGPSVWTAWRVLSVLHIARWLLR